MHIVFLSHEYATWSPGGVGTFLQTLGRALVKSGHEVSIVGAGKSDSEEQLEDKGVQLYRLPKNAGRLPDFLHNARLMNRKLRELQIKNPIDIIEGAEQGLAFVSKKHPAKKVIRLHGGHHFFAEAEKRGISRKKAWLEKRSFRTADGFIGVSNYVKSHTESYLSYYNKPVKVIHLPLDTSITKPDLPVKENEILFAGTVCEKKGARQLIEAFKILREDYPNKVLNLFGRDWFFPDGRSYIDMLKTTYDDSYFENVHFHGSIPRKELMKKYAEAAFCVFPSHMETQGLVSIEAMLMQKPVIFTKYGPGPETISHGETGLLCDVYEPNDIADKMKWCIQNPNEANEMGLKAEEVVRKRYDKNKIVEENIQFYQQL